MVTYFYLASKSPRRKELLTRWGYRFETLLSDQPDSVDENVLEHESADHYVQRIASEKSVWGFKELSRLGLPVHPVLAADTTVVMDGIIYGKPENTQQAYDFLSAFSGKTHEVLTAVAIAVSHDMKLEALSRSYVTFRPLTKAEILAYIATGEPMDKAGAYGIQGKAGAFVEKICGSYSGIMGLPQMETVQLLQAAGFPYF
ncbi:septum formation inhibitor Maf [Parasutterella sp. NM82_D38]|uniref:dTTP/UTP pyrophosphatase n=1 Tax=Parasutterella muris TaxID=2565572 RepID=A0A6L6YGW6_9BURK|nr:Maf family protein [uncultured Parasutterella sp.]MVX56940.1 septum formation inhibitor Maf [Parasutterella muris]